MFVAETLIPRRVRSESRSWRTLNNLLIAVLNSVLIRSIPIISAVGAATIAQNNHWGAFNQLHIPFWGEVVLVVLIFDFVIYCQHVASHKIPLFWRFHKMHHADHDLDASSGLRFHPVEILVSMLVKCFVVIAIGASPLAVMIFEVVLNSCAIFNHSNIYIPSWLDRLMRFVIVTPDMHRIHHSVHREETDSNYGFNIPLWDYLFRTYRQTPVDGQLHMSLGLDEFPESRDSVPLIAMLKMPFLSKREQNTANAQP